MFGADLPRAFYPMTPGYDDFSLRKKTAFGGSADTYATAVSVKGRKVSADIADVIKSNLQLEEPVFAISIYDMGESTFVAPEAEDEITDPDGIKYRVRHVGNTVLDTLYKCLCTRKRVQS